MRACQDRQLIYDAQACPGCTRLAVGDAVWGILGKALADYTVHDEKAVGLKPSSLDAVAAGTIPEVGLSSLFCLKRTGAPWAKKNLTVVVTSGSGGTGFMGIQLAKAMGATEVITTCSAKHGDFVRSMGADRVIDYHTQNYWEVLAKKSVDVVYDCVGLKGTGDHSYPLLKQKGKFISLLTDSRPSVSTIAKRLDVKSYFPLCVGSCSNYDRIDKVAALVEAGKLKVHIDTVYALEDIAKAFNQSIGGHTTGKVVVQMIKDPSAGPMVVV